jgi:hypothetical protein
MNQFAEQMQFLSTLTHLYTVPAIYCEVSSQSKEDKKVCLDVMLYL